jgi:hypothetical protein
MVIVAQLDMLATRQLIKIILIIFSIFPFLHIAFPQNGAGSYTLTVKFISGKYASGFSMLLYYLHHHFIEKIPRKDSRHIVHSLP